MKTVQQNGKSDQCKIDKLKDLTKESDINILMETWLEGDHRTRKLEADKDTYLTAASSGSVNSLRKRERKQTRN